MSKEVGLTTDGTLKSLTNWDEEDFFASVEHRPFYTNENLYFSFSGFSGTERLPLVTDLDEGTKYYLDPNLEKYIKITTDFNEFTTSTIFELPFFTGARAIKHFTEIIDEFTTLKANSYGYPSISSAISYQNCGITAWEEEAIAFNTWRANIESLMYDNIFSYTADGITLPSLAGFTAQAGYFDVGITSRSRPVL